MDSIPDARGESKETKKDRFKRIASRRTRRIIKELRVLSNCSNRSAYDYSDEDVNRIFDAINEEVRLATSKFRREKRVDFKL